MLGHTWYNELLKKYVVVFGTMFNDIVLTKSLQDGTVEKQIRVPISFGPKEKYLVRKEADPNLDRPYATTLPRMAFEMTDISYDGNRKLNTTNRFVVPDSVDNTKFRSVWQPVPYDMTFQLNIMCRTYDDGAQIIEQIIPFFTPEWTNTVVLFDNPKIALDVPLVLNSISPQDTYESDFQERRVIIWTLDFTMKGYFFGPVANKKIIKIANTNLFASTTANTPSATIHVTPGMDANGVATTDPALAVDPLTVDAEDDWAYVVQIQDAP